MEINDFVGVYEKCVEKKVCEQLIKGFEDHKHLPGFRENNPVQKTSNRKDDAAFFDTILIRNMSGGTPYLTPTVTTFNEKLQNCFDEYPTRQM